MRLEAQRLLVESEPAREVADSLHDGGVLCSE
jgi:hypothetical protein